MAATKVFCRLGTVGVVCWGGEMFPKGGENIRGGGARLVIGVGPEPAVAGVQEGVLVYRNLTRERRGGVGLFW